MGRTLSDYSLPDGRFFSGDTEKLRRRLICVLGYWPMAWTLIAEELRTALDDYFNER
jgi:hypothetical protein